MKEKENLNEEKEDLKGSFKYLFISIILVFITIVFWFCYDFFVESEKFCVKFYNENDYVLGYCNRYKSKLLEIKKQKEKMVNYGK